MKLLPQITDTYIQQLESAAFADALQIPDPYTCKCCGEQHKHIEDVHYDEEGYHACISCMSDMIAEGTEALLEDSNELHDFVVSHYAVVQKLLNELDYITDVWFHNNTYNIVTEQVIISSELIELIKIEHTQDLTIAVSNYAIAGFFHIKILV